ncbi:MAG: penicillin-binding protein 1C [Ignavibacteria bacterium]|nr:penicillin-binding protein 1C [Ignavibacteria bacterium]
MNRPYRIIAGVAAVPVFGFCAFLFLSLLFPLPPLKPYSTVVVDRHGEFIHAFLAPDDIWRIRTSPDEIPQKLKRVLLEKEDRYFYYHPGVNPISVVRAAWRNLVAGKPVSGASTISMQVARMLEPKERTFANKLIETFRALQLEFHYPKDAILEMYLSIVPLGGNIEGLESAALLYYQTPLERLNIAHLIDLILIPNDPNRLRPDRNGTALLHERIRRGMHWVRTGLLTASDSLVIVSTPGAVQRTPLPRRAPHFSLRVRDFYPGEDEIRSSLDLSVQKTVELLLTNHMRIWKPLGVHNGAVVVIDNRRNEIVGYAGSENFEDTQAQGQVDAVKALRSPGSTLKPFLCALAMDRGILTPKTRLLDTPYDAEGFLAENYDGRYSGLVTTDDALRRSLNVPMIRLLHQVGLTPFLDQLSTAGVFSLTAQRDRLGISLILGGCGVTLEEMTTAYSVFARSGWYSRPSYRVDRAGRDSSTVFSPATTYMITHILSGINRPDLPNNFESSMNLPLVAFKTGTSYGRRDAWSIGFSAEYTVGVWIGNVTNRGSPDLVGSSSAAPLLIDVFNSISSRHEKSIMPMPKDIGVRSVCALSGQPATPRCPGTIDDYYSRRHSLSAPCQVHREFLLSVDGSQSYCATCVGNQQYTIASIVDYPRELRTYWDNIGISYTTPPLHNPQCTSIRGADGPTIVSPSPDMTYFLLAQDQQMVLSASSPVDVTEHMWYVDERYVGRYRAGEKVFIRLDHGSHVISCLDDRGRISMVTIDVKRVL